MSCYVKIVNNSRKSEIKYVLEHAFEFFDTLEDLYSKIIFIIDSFHQLRVFQRVLFKRCHYLGLQD